jgi:CubicO group peptidase (beta-lactamase class C family)
VTLVLLIHRIRSGSRPWAWILLLVFVPGLAAQEAGPEAHVRVLLDSLMQAEAIPGLSIAVGIDGVPVWAVGMGAADVAGGRPVTPGTLFRVGSVSKSMTAMGLGVLVDRGEVDLDAPVQVYVPGFPEKEWPITTRQLGGHIAGIRHYRGDEFWSDVYYPDVVSGLAIFAADPLLFEPETDYTYSSYGWNLLSAVMEGASGEPFLSFMAVEVFEPLGRQQTIPDRTLDAVPERTVFYELDGDGVPRVASYVDNSYKWAGGGFLSTPSDLVRFSSSVLEPGFVSEATLELLLDSQYLRNGEATGYGIGWRDVVSDHGHRIAHHTGGSVGGTTSLWIDRTMGVTVAVVANRGDAPITGNALMEMVSRAFQPAVMGAEGR